jgi:hypothetical protein
MYGDCPLRGTKFTKERKFGKDFLTGMKGIVERMENLRDCMGYVRHNRMFFE